LLPDQSPSVGPEIFDPVRIDLVEAEIEDRAPMGTVVHVDRWGNLITKIPPEPIVESALSPGDPIEIAFGGRGADRAGGVEAGAEVRVRRIRT